MVALGEVDYRIWVILGVQVLGLVSAAMARVSVGSRTEPYCQRLFIASLVLVGVATISALGLGPGHWLALGTTLAVMVLTVTWDFRASGVRA